MVTCSFFYLCVFRLYVDGPFGSPSEEVFNYDVSLCVAGGIGVTPFACVLHALLWVVRFQKRTAVWLSRVFTFSFFFLLFLPALSFQWRLDWFPVAEVVLCVGLQGAPVLLLVRWAAERCAPQGQDKGRPLVSTCNIHSDMLEPKLTLQCSWILLVHLDKLHREKFSTRHSTELPVSFLLVVTKVASVP